MESSKKPDGLKKRRSPGRPKKDGLKLMDSLGDRDVKLSVLRPITDDDLQIRREIQDALNEATSVGQIDRLIRSMAFTADTLEECRRQVKGRVAEPQIIARKSTVLKDMAYIILKKTEMERQLAFDLGGEEYVREFLNYIVESLQGVLKDMAFGVDEKKMFLSSFKNSTKDWQVDVAKRLKERKKN